MSHSYGALLQRDADGSGSYTNVAKTISIDLPEITITDCDESHLNSTSGAKTFSPGMLDGGECGAELQFDQSELDVLEGILRTAYYWKQLFPVQASQTNAPSWAHAGHINKLGGSFPEDDRVTISVSVKVSGVVTFTMGS